MDDLFAVAVLAFRADRYADAVDLLLQVVQHDKHNWLAWFYLGMSYGNSGNTVNAYRIFCVILASCPDQQLVLKARTALPALEEDVRRRFEREEPTAAPKKSGRTANTLIDRAVANQ